MSVRRPVTPVLGEPVVSYEDRLRATMLSMPKAQVGAALKAKKPAKAPAKAEPPPMLRRGDAKEELTNPPLRNHPKWAKILEIGKKFEVYLKKPATKHPLRAVFNELIEFQKSLLTLHKNDVRTEGLKKLVLGMYDKIYLVLGDGYQSTISEWGARKSVDNFPPTEPGDFSPKVRDALKDIWYFTWWLENSEVGPFSYSDGYVPGLIPEIDYTYVPGSFEIRLNN